MNCHLHCAVFEMEQEQSMHVNLCEQLLYLYATIFEGMMLDLLKRVLISLIKFIVQQRMQ